MALCEGIVGAQEERKEMNESIIHKELQIHSPGREGSLSGCIPKRTVVKRM